MHEKERLIQERRTNLAAKKNLLGAPGKLGMIAKWLGDPIVSQGGGLYGASYLDDPYEIEDEGEIPLAEDEMTSMHGYNFCGLSRGMHLEVRYSADDKSLVVRYKGYLVFREVAGDLMNYVPDDEWEALIDRLYEQAMTKSRKLQDAGIDEISRKAEEKKAGFLDRLRDRWGEWWRP
jgi:hypothetical protein